MRALAKKVLTLLRIPLAACFFLSLALQETLLRLLPAGTGGPLSQAILKQYLASDHRQRQRFLAKFGIACFGGIHPKNVFNFRYEFFKEHVGARDVVLDVGCGSGTILGWIAPAITQGIGVDLHEEPDIFRTSSNLRFLRGDALTMDYDMLRGEHAITVAIFSHLLEHLDDPVALLRRVCAPRVLICVPSRENWLAQLKLHLHLPIATDPTHRREYTRSELSEQLHAAQYRVQTIGFNSEGEIICDAVKA